MNTSRSSLVWPASMVANGDDTNGLGHSQESAAAARSTKVYLCKLSSALLKHSVISSPVCVAGGKWQLCSPHSCLFPEFFIPLSLD